MAIIELSVTRQRKKREHFFKPKERQWRWHQEPRKINVAQLDSQLDYGRHRVDWCREWGPATPLMDHIRFLPKQSQESSPINNSTKADDTTKADQRKRGQKKCSINRSMEQSKTCAQP